MAVCYAVPTTSLYVVILYKNVGFFNKNHSQSP